LGGSVTVFCQLCAKEGHIVIRCFKRFDHSFIGPPQKSAAAVTNSYGVDTNWYIDSGATDHITSDLEKLTIRDRYNGGD
jgi:histone deacetylase 1/2